MGRALGKGVADEVRVRLEVGTPLPDRGEEVVDRDCEFLLHLNVTNLADEVALFEVVHLVHVGVECVVVDEDGIALDVSGVGRAEARGVGEHPAHLLVHGVLIVLEEDRVAA